MHYKTLINKTFCLMLLMALFMPWKAQAQETLTVCDGTNSTLTTNSQVPMYGNYFDDFTKSEFVIPAVQLTEMESAEISALKFYISSVGSSGTGWGGTHQVVFLKEVESASLSAFSGMDGATVVFEGTFEEPASNATEYEIAFTTNYEYQGGNLLIGIYNTVDGGYRNVTWYGETVEDASGAGSNSSNLNNVSFSQKNFIPKTTFTYTPAGGVSCAKPKSLNTVDITAHTATLTWTAGAEGQSNWDVFVTTDATIVPDNTTPTYQVTECSKELSGLTAQTTYYVYVRAVCAADDKSKWANKTFATTREALTVDSNNPYSQNFETSNDWGFANGTMTNQWCWGGSTNNGGAKSMYVSKDGGTTYQYAHSNTAIYASKLFNFAQGTYTFSFDWNAKGESNYDYLRVALAPGDVEFTAGTQLFSGVSTNALPNGWIALDGGSKLNLSDGWQTKTAEATVSGTYTMVFIWCNDNGGGDDTPAAIDNISISYMTCPRPTALTAKDVAGRTATLSWKENGTATNWVLQYATNNSFTENLTETNVSGTASRDLTGLLAETKYYARVKSVLGSDESSWSDVKDFTTLATCPKPNLSFVSYSNTAFSGKVSWTGSIADAFEIAYRPTSDFDPSDYTLENVTRIQLENVTEYTYTLENLAPETKYYIYIQANCGDEDGKSQWSNRVTFTTLATCLAPSYLTEESVSSNSVTLSWTKGAEDQDAWQFRYKKTSDSEYTYVLVENNPSNSYELTGLEPATSYDVNVRAWCGGNDYSKWSLANQNLDKSITTACASINLPYTCDFEGAVETDGHFSTYSVPKCWDRIEMQYGSYSPYTYYPYIDSQSSNAHSGTKSLLMYRTPNSANQTIILPEIDEQYEMTDLQIRFWAKAGSSNNTLSVGIMENGTFSEVQAVEGVSTTYAEYTVLLTNYTGNGRNIAIKCGSSSSYLYYYIDDVKVEEIPSCFIPTGLANTAVTYNSASFVWQAGKDETEWNIQYKKASDSEWDDNNIVHVTELPTTEHPFVLSGLQRGTDYQARIQAYCDADDQSEWSTMPVSFTTDCGIWPIDAENSLFEDFSNSAFPPSCWSLHKDSHYYGWQHDVGVSNPLGQDGTAYSYWPDESYLVLPQMHINGSAKLTFDMAFGSSGSGEVSSVVLSTGGYAKTDFTTTLWTATEFPTTRTNVSIDLSAYNNRDIYIAFKFVGNGYSGRLWYIDNVHIFVGEAFTKSITAYSENGGYYLIASPVGTANPENVVNMLSNKYDLYSFDQSEDLEWRNHKQDGGLDLISGKGYLYANDHDVTLRFTGTPYNNNGQVDLVYDGNAKLKGWNLIGNPFPTTATVDKPNYRLTENGSALNTVAYTESTPVSAMEGLFVQATATGQTATFTQQTRGEKSNAIAQANLTVNHNGSTIDNAIVRFDGGQTLGKFQLRENSTKVYFTEGNQDYAIVNSEAQGELPVNFKAAENGTYTINVATENLDVDYLHLIDNLTGTDVDLLATPTYTFESRKNDYASRFRLRFSANDNNNSVSDEFAFVSNGEIIVNGQGTLKVIDMTGRIVLSRDARMGDARMGDARMGDAMNRVSTEGMTPGVYVLRLIDGNEVKTQKIVIR